MWSKPPPVEPAPVEQAQQDNPLGANDTQQGLGADPSSPGPPASEAPPEPAALTAETSPATSAAAQTSTTVGLPAEEPVVATETITPAPVPAQPTAASSAELSQGEAIAVQDAPGLPAKPSQKPGPDAPPKRRRAQAQDKSGKRQTKLGEPLGHAA